MDRARKIIIAVVALLAIVVMLQNIQAVETKLLFMTVTMPRALLLMVTFLLGLAVGVVLSGFWFRKRQKNSLRISVPGSTMNLPKSACSATG